MRYFPEARKNESERARGQEQESESLRARVRAKESRKVGEKKPSAVSPQLSDFNLFGKLELFQVLSAFHALIMP